MGEAIVMTGDRSLWQLQAKKKYPVEAERKMSVLPDKMKTSAGGSVGLQGAPRRPATRWKHSFSRRLFSDKPVATHADESSQQFC